MPRKILLFTLLVVWMFSFGCRTKPEPVKPDYGRPLPPGMHALRKITDPAQIPDFTMACSDLRDLRESIANSLSYLSKPSSQGFFPSGEISHDRTVESLETFQEMLESGLMGDQLNQAIRDRFDVYISVGCDDQGTVLFTGYYTPIFEGSTERSAEFMYPLYKQPDDLVKGPNGEILGRRTSDGQVIPYPQRAVIEAAKMLRGNELIWLGDAFEAFIAHVQGSAKVRLPDGRLVTVGYAANNGQEYRSVGEAMVKDGVIRSDQLSLSSMIEYFKSHPDQVDTYTRRNPRFVFFRKEEGEARGSLNEEVTPMRTIATDKSIFPRAALGLISTALPQMVAGQPVIQPYSGFVLDQDTGGAIRAPGRCDVYMGVGDTAGQLAGQTYQEGRLYYLFVK
ncbi:MAG: MltA domain-containing protein [Sedimentisphaerales bacterium]|nr:MltA domain-containing protein [Sedimentisphaerales bacterium]